MQAHKFLLALASSVFRTGFFGEFEQENKIDMKETTLKAFKIMIEIIYKLPVNLKTMSVDELFELVNLAEHYAQWFPSSRFWKGFAYSERLWTFSE